MTIIGVALLVVTGAMFVIAITAKSSMASATRLANWERAKTQEKSLAGRMLLSVAKPFTRVDKLYDTLPSRQYRYIEKRLLGSGQFAREVEVFLAVQAAAILVGLGFLAIGLTQKGFLSIVIGLLGLLLMVYPWNLVAKASAKRAEEVTRTLPDFVELLAMTVEGGMGLEAALSFTAKQTTGIVSEEVKNMLLLIRNNPSEESQAYHMAGARLGTPEAKTFFVSLLQAQMEGTKVLENLHSQAASLRVVAYQHQRAEVKKLPIKMVIILGVHLLPLLFTIALFPLFVGLTHL